MRVAKSSPTLHWQNKEQHSIHGRCALVRLIHHWRNWVVGDKARKLKLYPLIASPQNRCRWRVLTEVIARPAWHLMATLILLSPMTMELYFFHQILDPHEKIESDGSAMVDDWGLEQDSDAVIWAAVIVDSAGHVIGTLVRESRMGILTERSPTATS